MYAIKTCILCIFYSIYENYFFAFKDFFLENFILIYDLFKSGF